MADASAPAASASTKLLGMGNPLLDISANVPMSVLEKYEVTLNNAILAEDKHLPLYEELVKDHEVEYIAGGATQNSIRVAQWMLGSGYAGATAYIGCIGADAFGNQLKESVKADGVEAVYLEDAAAATGTCAVLVNDGERSLVANLAAANNYKIDHLHGAEAQRVVTAASLVYSAGFFITVSPDTMLEVAQMEGKQFCLNLSAPFIVEVPPFLEALEKLLPHTAFLFGNETEAMALGKAKGWDAATVADVAKKVAELHPAVTVVFTQGSESTIVARGDAEVEEHAVEPLPKEKLVDTNGAGDAFVGGFLSGLVQGKDIKACVDAGHYAAREVIQRSGCTFPESCIFTFAS